jgi:putative transposase
MRFAFIDAEKASYPVTRMCRVLGVSQSGYFAWKDRPACARQRQDLVYLALAIVLGPMADNGSFRTAFALSNGTYGSPRMHRDLVDEGHEIGRHRTARLMRENRLVARQKRRFKRTTDSEHAWPPLRRTIPRIVL